MAFGLSLTQGEVAEIKERFGTPVYVYDQASLEQAADETLAFPNLAGLTVRYAMKAAPNAAILRIFQNKGLHIDASSGHEVERAAEAGLPYEKIQLTAQQLPDNLAELVGRGMKFNACSLRQLDTFGQMSPDDRSVSVRLNPGLGSGHSNRTNVGGPGSSFGIWKDYAQDARDLAQSHGLNITRVHSHIGSGSDPDVWVQCVDMTLDLVREFPDVTTVNLGGGYKIARVEGEVAADLQVIGGQMLERFQEFERTDGRRLHLEIEPGTYLVGNSAAIVASIIDIVDTGHAGYDFIKTDAGMTELLRPSLYGSQHPIAIVPNGDVVRSADPEMVDYMIVGHCCESGDILTPAENDPEELGPRKFPQAEVGDFVVIGGAGAYASGMSAKHYNSFPEAPEVLRAKDGSFHLIRDKQDPKAVYEREVIPDFL